MGAHVPDPGAQSFAQVHFSCVLIRLVTESAGTLSCLTNSHDVLCSSFPHAQLPAAALER